MPAHARLALLAVALLLGSPGGSRAQPAPVRVAVTGTVQDQTGAVLAGADVVLIGGAGTPDRTVKSDGSGVFRFDNVPAGAWELRAQYQGFKPTSVRLRVGPRPPARQKLVLALASIKEEITVGDRAVDTAANQNRDAIAVDQKLLKDLPVFDRDVVGAASRFLDPAAAATAGTTLVVDGMEARKLGVSASAIQQIKINQDPYAAEFARPGSGRIEVTTKAGAEEYHGEFNLTFRDARLDAKNAFAATRPPEQRRIYEGVLGGPIRGKTSFLLSINREELDVQAIVFAVDPTGPVRANVPTPQRNLEMSGTITHPWNGNNTTSIRATYQNETSQNDGVGGTALPEVGSNARDHEEEIILSHQAVLTTKLVSQFRLLLGQDHQSTISLNQAPRIAVLDAFTAGGGQSDAIETEHHFTLNETITWSSGRHVVKSGFSIPDWSRRGFDDRTNFGGTFSFATLEDYRAGRPYRFEQQRGDGALAFMHEIAGAFVQDQIAARRNLSVSLGLRYDWQNFFGDNNNVVPRASFAYAPGSKPGTVIRGGIGLFNDRTGEGPISDVLHSRQGRLFRYVLLDPGYPDPLTQGTSITDEPTSLVQLAPDLNLPHTMQYSLGVEREIVKGTTVAINYTGARGYDLFRSRDINAPPPPLYAARPDLAHGVIRQIETRGCMRSHSLQMTLRGKATRFFSGSVQYVLGHAMNDTNGIGSFPANNYDLSGEWGRAGFDQRHRFELIGTIKPGPWFTLGVALSMRSGRPYSLTTGRDDYNTGTANARPPGVARNTLTGPGSAQLDLRWSHEFPLTASNRDEGPKVTLGVDGFNVLNRVNYSGYVGNLSSPFFGRAIAAQPPRRMQLSLRFEM
jgi:outer membrane receptor protein involved in Fe transport